MNASRAGENREIPNRHERFLEQNQAWFFHTREGAVEGPFESKSQASKALNDFLEFLSMATPRMPI